MSFVETLRATPSYILRRKLVAALFVASSSLAGGGGLRGLPVAFLSRRNLSGNSELYSLNKLCGAPWVGAAARGSPRFVHLLALVVGRRNHPSTNLCGNSELYSLNKLLHRSLCWENQSLLSKKAGYPPCSRAAAGPRSLAAPPASSPGPFRWGLIGGENSIFPR